MHKPSECHLASPTANTQTSIAEALNANDKATATLANSLAALRMDEACIIAGARQ